MRPAAGGGCAGRPAAATVRLLRLAGAALVILATALALAGGPGCAGSVETRVVFLRDWEAARERAASEGKPIMVNFYTDT